MPYGVLLLCDILNKNGISCKIFNTAAEISMGRKFSLGKIVKKYNPKILGFTLQWHSQMRDTFREIRRIKRIFKEKKIVVGGITASLLSKTIMEKENSIDFLIRGDAEIPLLKLCKKIKNEDGDFSNIENLSYRENKKIKENEIKYSISSKLFSSLNYSNFDSIINKEDVFKISNNFWIGIKNKKIFYPEPEKKRFFYITSRGCFFSCSYCSATKYHTLCKRKKPVYRSPESTAEDIKEILKQGIENIYFPTFPDPDNRENFYTKLFKIFRENNISFNCTIDCFKVPDKSFIDCFYKTFKHRLSDSYIAISPDSFNEKIRLKNKNQDYKNKDLLSFIAKANRLGVKIRLYLVSGLPFSDKKNFMENILYSKKLSIFKNLEIITNTVPIEPFSPLFLNPQKYKVKIKCKTLKNFIHKKSGVLGYTTNKLNENDIFNCIKIFNKELSKVSKNFYPIDVKNIN